MDCTFANGDFHGASAIVSSPHEGRSTVRAVTMLVMISCHLGGSSSITAIQNGHERDDLDGHDASNRFATEQSRR